MTLQVPASWKELAQNIQGGDRASENDLAQLFYGHILAMAIGRLRDPETAREITQETLLDVLRALREGRLHEPEKLPAYVIGTARHLINHHLRKQIQSREAISHDTGSALNPGHQVMSDEPDFEELEKKNAIRSALRKLRPIERRILFLTLAKGLTPREIALEMNMKPENIRNLKSRAVKAVQGKLKKMIRKGRQEHL